MSWLDSFDNILSHPRFLAYYNNDTNITTIYEIIHMLFRIELSMKKLVGDSKATIDAKWNKSMEDFIFVKVVTWHGY